MTFFFLFVWSFFRHVRKSLLCVPCFYTSRPVTRTEAKTICLRMTIILIFSKSSYRRFIVADVYKQNSRSTDEVTDCWYNTTRNHCIFRFSNYEKYLKSEKQFIFCFILVLISFQSFNIRTHCFFAIGSEAKSASNYSEPQGFSITVLYRLLITIG